MPETRQAQILNVTSVESQYGPRYIELFCGDILTVDDPLVVFSSHAERIWALDGQVVNAVETAFDLDLGEVLAEAIITPSPTHGTWLMHLPDLKRRWLMVRLNGATGQTEVDQSTYEAAVWTLFGSVAALELKSDFRFESLATTHLAGRRGFSIEMQTRVLIQAASQWLRTSRYMNRVRICVGLTNEEESVEQWRTSLDHALGRVPSSLAGRTIITGLRDELVTVLRETQCREHPELRTTCSDLSRELLRDSLTLVTIAILARKLCESIVAVMLHENQRKYERTAFETNVNLLMSSGIIASWSGAYFHTLRVLGNESVHYRQAGVLGVPGQVGDADAVTLFAALLRVVSIFDEWSKTLASKPIKSKTITLTSTQGRPPGTGSG